MAMKSPLVAFGQVVLAARLARSLTQEQLATRAGLNRNFVMAIEKGRRKPSLLTVFALAEGLGLAPAVLVSRTEKWSRAKK